MKGIALDSGEFISADELNARWLPRKATEEEMSNVQMNTPKLPPLPEPMSVYKYPDAEWTVDAYSSEDMNAHYLKGYNDAIAAIQAQGVPVAWGRWEAIGLGDEPMRLIVKECAPTDHEKRIANWFRLYTHPAPQQKPLTDEQIKDCLDAADQMYCLRDGDKEIFKARAIEAAHGIGDKK